MRTYRFEAVLTIVVLSTILSLNTVFSALVGNYTIPSSGSIRYGPTLTRPLHTEGKYIKDDLGNIVYLRGVAKVEFVDAITGWFPPVGVWPGGGGDDGRENWNEANVRAWLQDLRDNWGANFIGTFFWADWWKSDKSIDNNGIEANINFRTAIKEFLRLADEYGIYVQLRMYGVSQTVGDGWNIGTIPFPPYGSWPGVVESEQDWIDIWASIAAELKDYPNAIFCLYDEPFGFESDRQVYNGVADRAITAIRNAGFDGLIMMHWAFCGSSWYMWKWVDEGYQTYNIVFSNHIYRYHGTFASTDTSYEYIKWALDGPDDPQRGYKYFLDNYSMPILVAIGAFNGAGDNDEYNAFVNSLRVLNEWEIGYIAYQYFRSDQPWAIQNHEETIQSPNRVGQALIDAIAAGKP